MIITSSTSCRILKKVTGQTEVFIATVSRIINDNPRVAPETKVWVLKAIEYHNPSGVAQRLRSTKGKNRLITLMIPGINNPIYLDVVRRVKELAYRINFVAMVSKF